MLYASYMNVSYTVFSLDIYSNDGHCCAVYGITEGVPMRKNKTNSSTIPVTVSALYIM